MDAILGVKTCDKCGGPMHKDEQTIIITKGKIADSNDVLKFKGDEVRFACHVKCWDGIETN